MSEAKVPCPACDKPVRLREDGRAYPHKHATLPQRTCLGVPESNTPDPKGPWFGALYDGLCSVNECAIAEGDRIRADGQGGYECEDCEDDEGGALKSAQHADWQEQASAAAKRYITLMSVPEPNGDMAALAVEQELDRLAAVDELRIPAEPGPMPTPETFMDPFDLPSTPAEQPRKVNVSGQPEPVRDWQGRYIVKDPELGDFRWQKNGKPKGLTRVTTFVKAAQDNKAINDWGKRNVVIGASLRPDILRRAHGLRHDSGDEDLDKVIRDKLNAIVGELDTAAGGKVSADEGTYLHEETEFIDAGLKTLGDCPPAYQAALERYVEALAAYGLEPVPGLIERTVMVREFGGVVGTFDRIFFHRASGQYVIGDLKTGKTLKYGMDEIQAQLWFYAHGTSQNGVYDWNTDTWGPVGDPMIPGPHPDGTPVRVREDVAVIIHMPVQGPEAGAVYVRKADLVKGKAYAELCGSVRDWPKSKVQDWEPLVVEPAPTWEDRFAAVSTGEEATALWRLAKIEGIAGVRLNDLIRIARNALVARVDTKP